MLTEMNRLPLIALALPLALLLAACGGGATSQPKLPAGVTPASLSVCGANPSPAQTSLQPTDFGYRQLDQPKTGQTSKSPLTISGRANPFEGAFSVTLFDMSGKQIAGQNYHKDNQSLTFSVTLPFSVSAPTQACVWVHERSGRDGSPTNVTQVPVQLTP
jgi:hypothetical protein